MKEIKGKTHSIVSILFLVVLSGLIVFKGYKSFGFLQISSIIIFVLLVYWLFTFPGHYYFLIDRKVLYVKNTLNPFIYKRIDLSEIEHFKLASASYYGSAVEIIFKEKKGKFTP